MSIDDFSGHANLLAMKLIEEKQFFNLKSEQEKTLNSARRKYGLLAAALFFSMDVVYGKKRNFSKFKVLELIARVPYQAWEHVAYIAMTHTYGKPDFARRIFEFVKESRQQQDNEQWHLLMLEELTQLKGIKENFKIAIFIYIFDFFDIVFVKKCDFSFLSRSSIFHHAPPSFNSKRPL